VTRTSLRNGALALLGSFALGCIHIAPEPKSLQQSEAGLVARSLADLGLRSYLETGRGSPVTEWPLRRWDLDSLTLAALYTRSSLELSRAHVGVAEASIVTAAQSPNPSLALSPEFSANPGLGVSPWLAAVQFDWPVETAGKLQRRVERAEAATALARLGIPVEAWRIRLELRRAMADYVAARTREDALRVELEQQQHRDRLLAERVVAGATSQVDASLARVQRIQAEIDLADARRQRLDAVARIAAAVGVPETALAEVELDFPLDAGTDPLLGLDEVEARRNALHERWDVRQALAAYDESEATLRVELAKQYPDIHLGRGYQLDEGQNKYALALSFDVPILNHNEGPVAEAQASRREAGVRILETQERALTEIELALAHRRGAVEEGREMENLVREQRSRLVRAQAAYQLGAVGGLAVADAEIELSRATVARIDAQGRVQQALAELEAAIQGPSTAVDQAANLTPDHSAGDRP